MNKIKIITDSSSDLSKEQLAQYDIDVDPLCIIMDDKSYLDGIDTNPNEIFTWADANKTTPKTAAITYDMTKELIEKYKVEGCDIIFFCISEDMSTCCNVARMVAEDLDYSEHVYVINSMNLSTGIGLQILYAARLRDEGKSASEITDMVNERRNKVRASFVVDTLTYLGRGGRCSTATALLGNTLKLKPEIVVENGKMHVAKKYRGKQDKVTLQYVADLKPQLEKADKTQVFITHSHAQPEVVEKVKHYLEELNIFENITETHASGVISSHCGPGTLGVLFYDN
ncbi:MAG: DegV family protein [Lachnospiraceae bacterium]|nr:DegV family protein [Lachnospiraceae bacterium]